MPSEAASVLKLCIFFKTFSPESERLQNEARLFWSSLLAHVLVELSSRDFVDGLTLVPASVRLFRSIRLRLFFQGRVMLQVLVLEVPEKDDSIRIG